MPYIIPVPVPGRVVDLIEGAFPEEVCQAVFAAADARREVLRFRGPLLCVEDQADRERALSELHLANKLLAAYNPGLILKAGGSRG